MTTTFALSAVAATKRLGRFISGGGARQAVSYKRGINTRSHAEAPHRREPDHTSTEATVPTFFAGGPRVPKTWHPRTPRQTRQTAVLPSPSAFSVNHQQFLSATPFHHFSRHHRIFHFSFIVSTFLLSARFRIHHPLHSTRSSRLTLFPEPSLQWPFPPVQGPENHPVPGPDGGLGDTSFPGPPKCPDFCPQTDNTSCRYKIVSISFDIQAPYTLPFFTRT